jgi:hypothetical protein
MSQVTIQLSDKALALIAQLQKEIFNRRRKKVSIAGVVETLVESGAKSQSDKRFATSWKNLITDIEKAAKVSDAHGAKPANLTDAEWVLVLSHRTRTPKAPAPRATPARKPAAKKAPTRKPVAKAAAAKTQPDQAGALKPGTTKKPVAKKAPAQKPAAKKPAIKKAAASKPAAKTTAVKKPAVRSAAASKPAVKKPVASKPAAKAPAAKPAPAKAPAAAATTKRSPSSVAKRMAKAAGRLASSTSTPPSGNGAVIASPL